MFEKIKKLFVTVNQTNSSMAVQCIAPKQCGLRHTDSCRNCQNNIGKY